MIKIISLKLSKKGIGLGKILQDVWIIDGFSGIVFFHRAFDKDMDAQLFGGLMSALNSFAEILVKEGLTSFELSKKRFAIFKKKNIMGIIIFSIIIMPAALLKIICQTFIISQKATAIFE